MERTVLLTGIAPLRSGQKYTALHHFTALRLPDNQHYLYTQDYHALSIKHFNLHGDDEKWSEGITLLPDAVLC